MLSNNMRIVAWIALSVLGTALLCTMLILGLFYAMVPLHNLSLWRMERALVSSVVHPTDSSAVEQHSFFGSRYTDVSECTYVVGEFRSTSLPQETLLAEYEKTTINLFGFAHKIPVHVTIVDSNTSLPLDEPANDWLIDFMQNVDMRPIDATYYLIYLYEKGHPPWGDYRCFE